MSKVAAAITSPATTRTNILIASSRSMNYPATLPHSWSGMTIPHIEWLLPRNGNTNGRIMAAGLRRWVDGSYLLFVEPRLVGDLDVVSVRVADVCREVVGTPFGPKARFLV